MKRLLPILLFFMPLTLQAQAWDLNEVSVLMPLPRGSEFELMWSPVTRGVGGDLLPAEVYATLPSIVVGVAPEVIYRALRVVAIRVDPCFQEGHAPQPCRRQVRLVWQPLVPVGGRLEQQAFTSADAAVHTFHELNEGEWKTLISRLQGVRRQFPLGPGLPLQVHPHLRQQGYKGPFWNLWSEAVLGVIGARNLNRVTIMTVNPRGDVWVFVGWDVAPGQMNPRVIPRLEQKRAQAFFSSLDNTNEFVTQMNPYPPDSATYLTFLSNSVQFQRNASQQEMMEVVRMSLEINNPRLHNPGTVDCASCHVSRAVHHWAKTKFPQWDWAKMFPRENFNGPFNPTNTSVNPLRTDVLRAFGYFGVDPIISVRTLNESSISSSQMSRERHF